nr:hypothetical protein [uncultured Draconibacterium sp.]
MGKIDRKIGYKHTGHFGKEDTGVDTHIEAQEECDPSDSANDEGIVGMGEKHIKGTNNYYFQLT